MKPQSGQESHSVQDFRFYGTGRDLFHIFVSNLLFTLLTLGVYYFWAKTRTRLYLWGQSEFADDRFAYHGTGKELLFGWMKILLVFGGLVGVSILLFSYLDPVTAELADTGLTYLWLMVFIPLARIGTMRYRLSRLSWRGIRFSFRSRFAQFFKVWLPGILLTGLTLGLHYPHYHWKIRRFQVDHSFFGSKPFTFDNTDGAPLWQPFRRAYLTTLALQAAVILWLMFGPYETPVERVVFVSAVAAGLGLVLFRWLEYLASRRRFYWEHTRLGNARFRSTVAARDLFRLYTVNVLFVAVTLGLASPWVKTRIRRYDLEHLFLEGPLDLEEVFQEAQVAGASGEELAGFLDLDTLEI